MAPTFPPPPAPRDHDAERAARLEQLARRRAAAAADTSDDRTARLERLAARTRPTATADAATEPTRRRGRRAHPAKGARTAALGMSLVTTAGLAGLFAVTGGTATADTSAMIVSGTATGATGSAVRSSSPASPATTGTATTRTSGATTAPRSVDLVVPDPAPGSSTTTVAPSTSTVVDGGVFHNKWGDVQIEATFSPDGQLVDVVALQYPDDRGQSVRINQYAVPRLTSEALSAQSASVHTVSGATYTSDGYRKSLQSAIDVARAAGATVIS